MFYLILLIVIILSHFQKILKIDYFLYIKLIITKKRFNKIKTMSCSYIQDYLKHTIYFQYKYQIISLLYLSIYTIEKQEDNTQEICYTNGFKYNGLVSNERGPINGTFNNNEVNGIKSENITYSGDFLNGKFDGKGRFINKSLGINYVGNFKRGYIQGIGILTTPEFIYNGRFLKGLPFGKGTLEFLNENNSIIKQIYGIFRNNKIKKILEIKLFDKREFKIFDHPKNHICRNASILNINEENLIECVICCQIKKNHVIYGPCLHPFENDKKICLDCHHSMDRSCFMRNMKLSCPICRASVNYIFLVNSQ